MGQIRRARSGGGPECVRGTQRAFQKSMEPKGGLLYRVLPVLLVLLLTQAPPAASTDDDRKTIPEPKERDVSAFYDHFKSAIVKPAVKAANVPGHVAKIYRSPKEAQNVSKLDE